MAEPQAHKGCWLLSFLLNGRIILVKTKKTQGLCTVEAKRISDSWTEEGTETGWTLDTSPCPLATVPLAAGLVGLGIGIP